MKEAALSRPERAAELGKPIAVLKAGRTSEGASVARSHTGALVDDDAVIDAVFDASNIIRLRSRKFSPTLAKGAYAPALCELLLAVGTLAQAWGERLQVLEINPVKLVAEGGTARAWALDGLLETAA